MKKYGPTGITLDGYNDLDKCFLWEWDYGRFGPLTFDAERTLSFDGVNFMLRRKGHPDDEYDDPDATFSISLVRWLEEKVAERDPSLLRNTKWRYRTLWHEFLRITKVRKYNTDTALE